MTVMSEKTDPQGVRLSVTVSQEDYLRLEALKARRRTSRSGPATTQEIVADWIRKMLDAAEGGSCPA
jgi:hypothetical protein